MKIETRDNPTEPGIYAARQWYQWRILEWFDGAWWHEGRSSRWPASAEIEAFMGPLPVIPKDFTRPPLGKIRVEPEDWETQFDSTDSTPIADSPSYQAAVKQRAQEFDL